MADIKGSSVADFHIIAGDKLGQIQTVYACARTHFLIHTGLAACFNSIKPEATPESTRSIGWNKNLHPLRLKLDLQQPD